MIILKHGNNGNCPNCNVNGTFDHNFKNTSGTPQFVNSIYHNRYENKWECLKCHKGPKSAKV